MPEFDFDQDEEAVNDIEFQDPGGESALRRSTKYNPRIFPCPTCGRENMLTAKDVALHYQCDYCAKEEEAGY